MTDEEIKQAKDYLKWVDDLLNKEAVANKGLWLLPRPLTAAPAQTSPSTITPANFDGGGAGFFSVPGGGTARHIKTSGSFTSGFCGRSFVGTAGSPFIIVNTAGDIIGNSSTGTHGIHTVTDSDYYNWYGLDANNPILIRSASGGNGIQLPSRSGGSHFVIRNAVVDSPSASGMTANFGVSGSNFYESINLSEFRVFNAGQEGICYLGNTGGSYDGTNYVNNATVSHCFSYNSSREGTQTEHVNNLLLYSNTIINAGQTGGAGQNGLIQIHDCNGTVRDSIYDGAPEFGTLFTHGTTISNCYFRWTNNNPIFIGRTDNAYFAAFANRLNGQPLLFNNCIFHCDSGSTLAKAATVEERTANIEFRNCIFSSNITALYNDNRVAGFSNSLVGTISTNGNSKIAITAPTYQSSSYNVYSDYTHHGVLNSKAYWLLGMGFRVAA